MNEHLSPERSIPGAYFIEVPKTMEQVELMAQQTALSLIDHPRTIGDFITKVNERSTDPTLRGDKESRKILDLFLSRVTVGINKYDWLAKKDYDLEDPDMQAILLNLPQSGPKARINQQQRSVAALARGYLIKRFEVGDRFDWASTLRSAAQFFEAAVNPEPDLEMLTTMYDLINCQYPDISAIGSPLAISYVLGQRAYDPEHEEELAISADIGGAQDQVGYLINRREDYSKFSRDTLPWQIQYDALLACYVKGVDPVANRNVYQAAIRWVLKDSQLKAQVHSDPKKFESLPINPEILEAAQACIEHFDRYAEFAKVVNSNYEVDVASNSVLKEYDLQNSPADQVLNRRTNLRGKIIKLVKAARGGKELLGVAESILKTRGPNWQAIEFAQQGMQGYLILPISEVLTFAQKADIAAKVIDSLNLKAHWEQAAIERPNPNLQARILPFGGGEAIIATEGWIKKTELDSLLDAKVPAELRARGLEILKYNMAIRRDIPTRFTRMPTRSGDKYSLLDNPDLPGVIQRGIIRRKADGGLEYRLELMPDTRIHSQDYQPVINGSINFEHNRANVLIDPSTPSLGIDHRWVMEAVVLQLINRSCCPSFEENDAEYERATTDKETDKEIPGFIFRVGGYRADGTRKQFTQYAENNYQQAYADAKGDSAGVSLYQRNEEFRHTNPEDDRYLTYNKGHESANPGEPTERPAPSRLVLY
jgi:hypothetical protein